MGKRTNPLGLRLGYLETWRTTLPNPYNTSGFRSNLSDAAFFAASRFFLYRNRRVFWSSLLDKGFICVLHLFVDSLPGVAQLWELRNTFTSLFERLFVFRMHLLQAWLKGTRRRQVSLTKSMSPGRRPNRFRTNRFFFCSAALIKLGFSSSNASLVTRVVCDLFRKHRRHWVVFRFIKLTFNISFKRYASIKGIRLAISGKINTRRRRPKRARRRMFRMGLIPFQQFRHSVDYSYRLVATKFGAFGVKLWVFRQGPVPLQEGRVL
uniref:Ribosomal protein S3 n=1 Tax=Lotharella oceanica TaxID=641309 RepID=A0A140GYR6_9EUKA|nr:ribosomal protein S3 [Lotharella oceanica]AMN87088.1 ribosomal protein S3 [Lotharella oceanica]